MAPSPSREGLDRADGQTLLELARASIEHGLRTGRPLEVDAERCPAPLRALRASFVTLRRSGELRGCVGELEARLPLAASVANQAFSAAFRDPRFPPLSETELADLDLQISVLGPLERLEVRSEGELLGALRPGVDGLVIDDGARRATFLPAVWGSLPEPRQFVSELKRKAGLGSEAWPNGMQVWRYRVEEIPAE